MFSELVSLASKPIQRFLKGQACYKPFEPLLAIYARQDWACALASFSVAQSGSGLSESVPKCRGNPHVMVVHKLDAQRTPNSYNLSQ